MGFQSWWQQKSKRAKAITIIATALLLQIGLCFGTPATVSWSDQLLGTRLNGEWAAIGYMMFEALLACVVFLVLIGFLIFYRPADDVIKTMGTAPLQNPKNEKGQDDS